MSFQNYEGFQGQPGQQDASGVPAGAPPQQDAAMSGQMPESAGQFQGGNGGDPGSAGGQQPGGDAKTTLWYDLGVSFTSTGSIAAVASHSKSSLQEDDLRGSKRRLLSMSKLRNHM